MPYQFDVAGGGGSMAGGSTYVYVDLNVADNPNRVAVVAVGRKQNTNPPSISGADIDGGISGTAFGGGGGGSYEGTSFFYLLEESFPSGGGTFRFYGRFSGGFADYAHIRVAVFYNVAQVSPVTVESDADSSATIDTYGNGVILSAYGGAGGGGSITTGDGVVRSSGYSPDVAVASQTATGGGQHTMSWSSAAQGASFAFFPDFQEASGKIYFY